MYYNLVGINFFLSGCCFDNCYASKTHLLRFPGKSLLHMQKLRNTGKTIKYRWEGKKAIARELYEKPRAWFPLGGSWEWPSGRCVLLMLGETWWQRTPGGDPCAEAIRAQRDVSAFGSEEAVATPECARPKPSDLIHGEGCGAGEEQLVLPSCLFHSQS